MSGFFVPDLPTTGVVKLSPAEADHAFRVLRARPGEKAYLSNGKGLLALATFVAVQPSEVMVEIEAVYERPGEPPYPVALVCALLKSPDRMAWLVEKSVELGATALYFVPFARSIPRKLNLARLERVAIAALKQNLRSTLPSLHLCNDLSEIPWEKYPHRCFGEIGSKHLLQEALPSPTTATLWIVGPEGDLTPQELTFLRQKDCIGVSLGHLRLRAETAAILYLAALKTHWGY